MPLLRELRGALYLWHPHVILRGGFDVLDINTKHLIIYINKTFGANPNCSHFQGFFFRLKKVRGGSGRVKFHVLLFTRRL